MSSVRVYLVVSGQGNVRLVKRRPTLDWDEIAYPVDVAIPAGWGRVYDQLAIKLTIDEPPDPLPPHVGQPETYETESEPEEEGAPV